jgi:hypothetical protein
MTKAWKNRDDIIKWEVLELGDKTGLEIMIIKTKSKFRQGIRIAIDVGEGILECEGIKSKSFVFWEDTAPEKIQVQCTSKNEKISIYNIWDEGNGAQSQCYTSGMIREELEDLIKYSCNDFGKDTTFDKLIFTIKPYSN